MGRLRSALHGHPYERVPSGPAPRANDKVVVVVECRRDHVAQSEPVGEERQAADLEFVDGLPTHPKLFPMRG